MAHLYYAEGQALEVGERITVAGDEGRHAVRVARLRAGERIQIGDGAGRIAAARVLETAGDAFDVAIDSVTDVAPNEVELTVVQALAKGDRSERAVELCTEFGVDTLAYWQAERSVSRWQTPEKQRRGAAKWQRIAREAAKQSLRARVPQVTGFALSEFAAERDPGHLIVVLDPDAEAKFSDTVRQWLAHPEITHTALTVVVGPEGGISDAELRRFEQLGVASVKLGDTVLRTSSAGAAAIALFHAITGKW